MTHIKNLIQLQALRLVFMLLVLLVSVTFTAQSNFGQNRNSKVDYGRIELATNPSGYPILIDGKPAGNTSTTVRYIDLAPGTHRVEINFPNNTRFVRDFKIVAGKRECINLNFRPRTVSIQRPAAAAAAVVSPCPYTLSVSAPQSVTDGSSITFTSDVSYTGKSALNYSWTLAPSSARITNGAGTQAITVDSTGLGRTRITATLSVDDGSGSPNCRQSAQASTDVLPVAPVQIRPTRFDEFPSVSFDDDKARFDNLAIELQQQPSARAFIIVYSGRRSRAGQADRLGLRSQNYLTTVRGIAANRIVVVNGGYRERDSFEIYLVPEGAEPPTPTPSVQPQDIRPGTDSRLRVRRF